MRLHSLPACKYRLSCIIATYFVRHAVHLFLATHILAKYFVRHIFWDIFLVIYFVRHQHIGEDPFLNSEQQENKHTAPLLFCRPFAESVWLCSAFKKSALRAHTVAIEAKKHNTRFKQERLCVLCFPFLFLFGSGSVHIPTHMIELKTRFKPCNNLQTSQVLCFTFLFGSVNVLCSY